MKNTNEEPKAPLFSEFKKSKVKKIQESSTPGTPKLFSEYRAEKETGLRYLNEAENAEVNEWTKVFEKDYGNDLNKMDESFLGKLVGGVAGFLIGPTIGKVIANALGIEKGIFYDMLTSRLVTTALGSAITKYVKSSPKS